MHQTNASTRDGLKAPVMDIEACAERAFMDSWGLVVVPISKDDFETGSRSMRKNEHNLTATLDFDFQ